jgi:hypothetical protein
MLVDASTNAGTPPPDLLCGSFRVGGVSLALRGSSPDEIAFSPELRSFAENGFPVDIEVSAELVENLVPFSRDLLFNSGALWRAFRLADGFVFDFATEALGNVPYKRLSTSRDFSTAQLLLNRTLLGTRLPVSPLEYPTDELLITNYLAYRRLGVEAHGCGLIDSTAGGQLFLGHSGAGKSTTARLWNALRRSLVLSDDRIILRLEDGELRMHGTPWHGEAAFADQGAAKLARIFILQHGERNSIRLLPKARALGEVFARCFPPFHSAEGLDGTLEFIGRALDVTPCYEFRFVPEQSAVKAVLDFDG